MRGLMLSVLVILMGAAVFAGCGKRDTETSPIYVSVQKPHTHSVSEPPAEGRELMCLVDFREEAEVIAALYGIKLVDCYEHVAVFHTEEDPFTVIRRGEEQGWPLLEVNRVITLDDPVGAQDRIGS